MKFDANWAATKYQDLANEMVDLVLKLNDIKESAKCAQELMGDNGDPRIYLEQTVEQAGVALAMLFSYAKEYTAEAKELEKPS